MDPTDAETACFETGVKFGSLYHQFAGTPVSPDSADALARAIESSIENQPFCESVTVAIDEGRVAEAADPEFGYAELTGRLMDVEVVVAHAGHTVVARMETEDGYPMMAVVDVDRPADDAAGTPAG